MSRLLQTDKFSATVLPNISSVNAVQFSGLLYEDITNNAFCDDISNSAFNDDISNSAFNDDISESVFK